MAEQKLQPEQLTAYLDGELGHADRRKVEQALAGDPQLQAQLQQFRDLRQLVRQLPREQASGELAQRVLRRVERLHLVKGALAQPVRQLRWSNVMAAAIVLLAAGVGFSVIYQLTHLHVFSDQLAKQPSAKLAQPMVVAARDADRTPPVGSFVNGIRDSRLHGRTAEAVGGGRADSYALRRDAEAIVASPPTKAAMAVVDEDSMHSVVVAAKDLPVVQAQLEEAIQRQGGRQLLASNNYLGSAYAVTNVAGEFTNMATPYPPPAVISGTANARVLGTYLVYGTPAQLGRLRSVVKEVQTRAQLAGAPSQPLSVVEVWQKAYLDSEETGRIELPDDLLATRGPESAAAAAPAGRAAGGASTDSPAVRFRLDSSDVTSLPAVAAMKPGASAPGGSAADVVVLDGEAAGAHPAVVNQLRPTNQIWSYTPRGRGISAGGGTGAALEPMMIQFIAADAAAPEGAPATAAASSGPSR